MYNQLNNRDSSPPSERGTNPEPEVYTGAFESEYGPSSLKKLFGVLRRRLWLIVLLGLLFSGVAIGFSLLQTPKYEASIKILIGQARGNSGLDRSLQSEVQGLQQITQTMTEAVNSSAVKNLFMSPPKLP